MKWQHDIEEADMLKKYMLKEFIEILESAEKQGDFNKELCLKMLEQVKVLDGSRKIAIVLLDGTTAECENQ